MGVTEDPTCQQARQVGSSVRTMTQYVSDEWLNKVQIPWKLFTGTQKDEKVLLQCVEVYRTHRADGVDQT